MVGFEGFEKKSKLSAIFFKKLRDGVFETEEFHTFATVLSDTGA